MASMSRTSMMMCLLLQIQNKYIRRWKSSHCYCVGLQAHVHMHTHTHTHTHIHTHKHTHTHTDRRAHTHTYTHSCTHLTDTICTQCTCCSDGIEGPHPCCTTLPTHSPPSSAFSCLNPVFPVTASKLPSWTLHGFLEMKFVSLSMYYVWHLCTCEFVIFCNF